jgi:hypothetical protein
MRNYPPTKKDEDQKMEREAQSTLIAHSGGRVVTFDELATLPAPQSLGARHYPVGHADLIEATRTELAKVGLVPVREQFAVAHHDARLFATLDLQALSDGPGLLPARVQGERGLAFGLRHGNDKSIAIEMVCGTRVFVCDNMSFSGDSIILHRMHTKNVALSDEVGRGIQKMLDQYETFEHNIERLENTELSDADAKALLMDLFMKAKVMAPRYMPRAYGWYFEPQRLQADGSDALALTDVAPRSAWGLANAVTRTIKELESAAVRYQATMRAGRFFGLRSDVRDGLINAEAEDAEFEVVS